MDGIDVIAINVRISYNHGYIYRIYTFFIYAVLSCWYGIRLNYDLIIASSGPITIGIPGLVSHFIRRKPFVFEVRDLWPQGAIDLGLLNSPCLQKAAYWFERLCYRSASRIIALSSGMKDSIFRRYRYKNIFVIPNASDNQLFGSDEFSAPLPVRMAGKKLFLYTGSIGLMDDCTQIVRAAKKLQDRRRDDIFFVLIGEGKERRSLEKLRDDLQLTNIAFLGLISKENVCGWLKHAVGSIITFKNISVLDTCSPNE